METKEKKVNEENDNANKNEQAKELKASDTKSEGSEKVKDPHAEGSCCGGCG